MSRQNCECAYVLNTEESLLNCIQMSSNGVCYVLFRWDMAWGKKSVGQRAIVQRESGLGVRGPE